LMLRTPGLVEACRPRVLMVAMAAAPDWALAAAIRAA
jgi:hypothetical protein